MKLSHKVNAHKHLTGFYRGQVLKHLPHGRCKIYIPGVYSEEWISSPDKFPDAELAAPLFAGTYEGNGVFSYPNISSIVWCFFANDDLNYPVYFASTLGGQNAFGQHELIMPPRHEEGKALSSIISTDIKSDKHLITAGKTQVEFFLDGILSVLVSNPIRTEASVDYSNKYQLQRQDDHVVSRVCCELIESDMLSNMHCKAVFDISTDNGTISQETYQYFCDEETRDISSCLTFLTHSNAHNIDFGSANVKLTQSKDKEEYNNTCFNNDRQTLHILRHSLSTSGQKEEESSNSLTILKEEITLNSKYENALSSSDSTSTFRIKSEKNTGAYIESENHKSGFKVLVNASSEDGFIEIKVELLSSSECRSYMYIDKDGNMTIDASRAIILRAPNIKLDASSRIETKSNYTKLTAKTYFETYSTAANINTTSGKTTIRSNQETMII